MRTLRHHFKLYIHRFHSVIRINSDLEFEVLTPVVIKSLIFWSITSCSPLKSRETFRWNVYPSPWSKNKSSKTPV
jgi:hypothetical protein